MTYNPLAYTQGEAWLEWVAAVYESSAADNDYTATFNDYRDEQATEYDVARAAGYADTAMRLAEEIETETYERLEDLEEWS